MLTIKCAACKTKLWKYDKIGRGAVLRCHKDRITQQYGTTTQDGDKIACQCGKEIGIDKGQSIKMIRNTFTYTGMKR